MRLQYLKRENIRFKMHLDCTCIFFYSGVLQELTGENAFRVYQDDALISHG